MTTRDVAELQVLLEGVALPASKQELLAHAVRERGGDLTALLQRLPDRQYQSLDDVGEELLPMQPQRPHRDAQQPREESGSPPGGEAYTDASAEPGRVRERLP
jgi:Protein of unknown function (DUF2795)